MSDAIHPTPEVLTAFRSGTLPEHAAALIAAHLDKCPTCRQAIPTMPQVPAAGIPPELAHHPKYLILRELNRGGMGVVYQARHKEMGRQIVLKVIKRALLDQPGVLERFRREIQAAAQLSHPNIVAAYDAEQVGDSHMLVMEFVPGQSLAEVVKKKRPVPVSVACHFACQTALGLQHAHERNMVHRDIKPQNLMLTPQGHIKILDFALAKVLREEGSGTGLTAHNAYLGTPDYCAPEQAIDARKADIRADLYSLGCTLYFLLSGRPPFREDTVIKTLLAHATERPRPLPELRPEVPAALWQVVKRLLAKDPAKRFQTPIDVARALTPFTKSKAKQDAKRGSALPSGGSSSGKEKWIEAKRKPHPTVDWRYAPPAAHRTPPPPSSVPAASPMAGSNLGQKEGWMEAPEPPRRGMPPGTKAVLVVLSVLVMAGVLAGALKLISDAADREVAALQRSGKSAKTSLENKRPVDQPSPIPAEGNNEAPDLQDKRPQPGQDNDNADPPARKDIGGEPKAGISLKPGPLRLKLPVPPPDNGDAKPPGMTKDKAERTRHPETKKLPVKDYEASCEAARTQLRNGFDAAIDALAKGNGGGREKLKWMDIVTKEKERFDIDGLIPWSEPMRPHVHSYLYFLEGAQKKLDDAYDSLIAKELKERNDKEAERLRAEWKKRLDVKVMAQWRHIVNGKGPVRVHTLFSNGKLNDSEGDAKWNYDKGVLLFRWPAPNEPGGYWIERLEIDADGTNYTGNNLNKPEKNPNLKGFYVLDVQRQPITVGKPAPEIAGEDIDGTRFKLSDYRGKVVLLDFWGHW